MFLGLQCRPCCGKLDCIRVGWAKTAQFTNQSCNNPILMGTVTVNIPSKYEIPPGGLRILLSGGYDDKGTVNGDWGNGQERCAGGQAPPSLVLTSRTLTFNIYDTVGFNVGMSVCICIPDSTAAKFQDVPFTNPAGGTVSVNGWTVTHPAYGNAPGFPDPNKIIACSISNPLP